MTTADETHEFTEQEFKVIFGVCLGLSNREVAEEYKTAEDVVKGSMFSIFDKVGVSTRLELVMLVRDVLNKELRRRTQPPEKER